MVEKFGEDRAHSFFFIRRQSLATKRGLRRENGACVPGGQRPHRTRELWLKTSTRTLPLVPNRQTVEGGARKHREKLPGRTWEDEGNYRVQSTSRRARAGKGPGGAAPTPTHEHTLSEALEVDNSCGRLSRGVSIVR